MNKNLKKVTAAMLMFAITGSSLLAGSLSFADNAKKDVNIERIAGMNRYDTSATIATKFAKNAEKLILASGENFADALAGSPLSGDLNAPILLTQSKEMPRETELTIKSIKPKQAYVIGGNSSVDESQLKFFEKSMRVSGVDRIGTSVEVNKIRKDINPNMQQSIYNSYVYPDALAAGPLASKMNLELIPVEKATNPNYIFGGESTVKYNGNVTKRFSGKDRYETSVEIAKEYLKHSASKKIVIIASGEDYPDALSSSIISKAKDAPIVLVGKNHIPDSVRNFLKDNQIDNIIIVGGVNSVSQKVQIQLKYINKSTEEVKAEYSKEIAKLKSDIANYDKQIKEARIERISYLEKVLEGAEKERKIAQEWVDNGVFSFLHWTKEAYPQYAANVDKALEILRKYVETNEVNPTLKGDATSYDNLMITDDLLEENNQFRASDNNFNVGPMHTNFEILAKAMVSANRSTNHNNGHRHTFQVAENLAWGMPNPYYGWYDMEKALYDKDRNDPRVGHYTNLMDDSYKICAIACNNNPKINSLRITFAWNADFSNDLLLTEQEYKQVLNEYYNIVESKYMRKELPLLQKLAQSETIKERIKVEEMEISKMGQKVMDLDDLIKELNAKKSQSNKAIEQLTKEMKNF